MNKNLRWKVIVIIATLLVFVFGIFGVPKSWSGSGLLAAMTDRIHLGLDLKGGTHLILQVQVNDAVNADSDRAIERLKDDLRTRKISSTDITKPDPVNNPDKIVIKGVPPEVDVRPAESDFRPFAGIRRDLGGGEQLGAHDEAAAADGSKESRRTAGH